MVLTNCKRFNTARESLEDQIRIMRSDEFFYEFDKYGNCFRQIWDSPHGVNRVEDAHEMIEIALKHLEKYGHVSFEGFGGISREMGYGYQETYGCSINNTPRATKKQIITLARLKKLSEIFRERSRNAKGSDKKKFHLKRNFRTIKLIRNLKKRYDWRDEMFRENGLVGLRNVNGDILVPCGEYDYIHGCDYGDDITLAIASRDGSYGLIKRDGKGTVVTPFNYFEIERWDNEYADNIHIGYREEDNKIVRDLIVNGQVVVSGSPWIEIGSGAITYEDRESRKHGFIGVLWDWIFIDPIYDDIIYNDEQPYFTFVKNGEEGVLTTNKEFIPLEKWNSMSEQQQDDMWEDVLGCLLIDYTVAIPIVD